MILGRSYVAPSGASAKKRYPIFWTAFLSALSPETFICALDLAELGASSSRRSPKASPASLTTHGGRLCIILPSSSVSTSTTGTYLIDSSGCPEGNPYSRNSCSCSALRPASFSNVAKDFPDFRGSASLAIQAENVLLKSIFVGFSEFIIITFFL